MVEERLTSQEDIDFLAMEGRDDGFNLGPIETARLLALGRDSSMEATSYFAGGELIAVSGLYTPTLLGDTVHIWMVSALAVKRHQIAFLRHVPRVLAKLHHYTSATCFCDPSFHSTCRWLLRAGWREAGSQLIAGREFLVLEKDL